MKSIIKRIIATLITTVLMLSCEQENYEPNLTAAPGGGTVTTFKAYTLTPATADNIYGRIVFYKYSSKVTLVQIGLYNTDEDTDYTASIFKGKASGAGTSLVVLDGVDGATGAFGTNKFFLITTEGFYDGLSAYDANVKVMLSASTVSGGDIGVNAEPVEEVD